MMRRTTFLISALCLLIIANVLMISFASPAFKATGEGFANYMTKTAARREGFEEEEEKEEGYKNYSGSPSLAKDKYEPIGSFDGIKLQTGNTLSDWRYTAPNEPLNGPEVEMGPDNLFMFKNNQCKPECCGASYSCNGGCVCTSPQQRKYINERGGNRTAPDAGV